MKASELIDLLQDVINEYGNVKVKIGTHFEVHENVELEVRRDDNTLIITY